MQKIIDSYRKSLDRNAVLYLNIKVIPKAQKTEFVELLEDGEGNEILKIKVAAVPEKGKANAELCRYLAKEFGVSKSSVQVVSGQTSQRKLVKLYKRSEE